MNRTVETNRRIREGSTMLAGCPGAERLHQAVVADPHEPLAVAITGPGGCGKTALLTAVGDTYRAAGVRVVGPGAGLTRVTGGGVAVLVDDAHHLDRAELDRLRGLVDGKDVHLVVAYRPWPRSPGLSELASALRRSRPPVVLEHLDRAQIRARAGAAVDGPLPPDLVDLLEQHTGGLPELVDRVVTALDDSGALDDAAALSLPWQVVDHLRHDLDGLDAGARSVMLAIAVGATLDTDVLSPVLGVDRATISDLIDQSRATGLVLGDGTLVPMARQALLAATPTERIRTAQSALLDVQLERGAPVLDLARGIVATGVRDPRVASVLSDAADRALHEDPSSAPDLYAEAISAGAPSVPLSARRAAAAALTGDLDTALQLADQALNTADHPDLARGVTVAATVLAHRGLLSRSADLYRWLGADRVGQAAPLAALSLLGTGAADEATAVLTTSRGDRPPTLLAGAESLMVSGLQESLAGSTAAALSTLTRAAALLEPAGRTVLLPDTPAALAALVALHCGELDVAESVLERAVAHDLGGVSLRARHRLLLAWTAMMRGHVDVARAHLDRAAPAGGTAEPRDELFARALQVGLARRASDLPGLAEAWSRAREAIVRHPVDLFVLLPLGELAVAAGRLRTSEQLAPHLAQAHDLLHRLGDPVLWATPLHWAEVHAAIYAEKPADLEPHAAALVKAARTSAYARTLATAGRSWLQVLRAEVDAVAVESAARGLQAIGLGWDGCRLAGQAAVRTTDRKAMATLLQCARALQAPARRGGDPSTPESAATLPDRPQSATLSDRELEVARLVLAGRTYREIGAQLYISAKTVEHHVARMRQRLGAANRSELFARLRAVLEGTGTPT